MATSSVCLPGFAALKYLNARGSAWEFIFLSWPARFFSQHMLSTSAALHHGLAHTFTGSPRAGPTEAWARRAAHTHTLRQCTLTLPFGSQHALDTPHSARRSLTAQAHRSTCASKANSALAKVQAAVCAIQIPQPLSYMAKVPSHSRSKSHFPHSPGCSVDFGATSPVNLLFQIFSKHIQTRPPTLYVFFSGASLAM